ncbi:MAG TPA: PIG-L deacetylase family protein [Nocardioidaceae bacterium]|nr:PIG-L deacetylase family protein [Nocardioidaceae bacterium]
MSPTATPALETGTLLGIWAHPDDEAFLSAGLMAAAARAGNRVVVATATRGELGATDPSHSPEVLSALREQELARSLALVGVTEHRWLGHRDGGLAAVRRRAAVAQVTRLVDEVRPDTIVTFGPDGMTGHIDHRTVSSWVTRAWHETGRRSALWYATLTPAFHRAWGALNDDVGLWYPGHRPPSTEPDALVAQVDCRGDLGELKHAALRAHASQTDGLATRVGEQLFRAWWATESFVAAPGR